MAVFGYQSIVVKYIGPTNSRGSRMKAISQAGSITISYDYSLSSDELHWKAAKALIEKLRWDEKNGYKNNEWAMGWLPDGSSVFTRIIPDAVATA